MRARHLALHSKWRNFREGTGRGLWLILSLRDLTMTSARPYNRYFLITWFVDSASGWSIQLSQIWQCHSILTIQWLIAIHLEMTTDQCYLLTGDNRAREGLICWLPSFLRYASICWRHHRRSSIPIYQSTCEEGTSEAQHMCVGFTTCALHRALKYLPLPLSARFPILDGVGV